MRKTTAKTRSRTGFTLIEMTIVGALLAILVTMGFPALQNQIRRSRVIGIVNETTNGLRLAKYQAIKTNRPTVYWINPVSREVLSWVDDNDDGNFQAGEKVLQRTTLAAGLYLNDPDDMTPDVTVLDYKPGPIFGFTGDKTRYNSDGSVDEEGGFRFADHTDAARARNFVQVTVRPIAVGRVEVKKWQNGGWWAEDEGDQKWVWE